MWLLLHAQSGIPRTGRVKQQPSIPTSVYIPFTLSLFTMDESESYRHLSSARMIMYGVLGVASLIVFILAASDLSWYTNHNVNTPAEGPLGFMIFAGLVTFLSIVLLAVMAFTSPTAKLFGPLAQLWQARYELVPLAVLFVFWLSGAASLTDQLGGGLSCGSISTDNPSGIIATCTSTNAILAFAWICFTVVTLTILLVMAGVVTASRAGDPDVLQRGIPPMYGVRAPI